MEVDYTGAPTVASVIKNTKLNKFIIYKAGTSRNSVPVLDFSHGTSTDDAIESFNDWAKLANNNNPYEMILFKKDGDQDQDVVPGKKKEKLIKFSFCLNGSGQGNQNYFGYGGGNAPIGLIMENANLKSEQKISQFIFQSQMDEMKRKIEELEEEDDDSDQLAGLANSPLMGALVEHLTGKKLPVSTINGPGENTTQSTQTKKILTKEQVERIKTAINILSNYSDQLDSDLLKMSALAQNKPDTFKMLLSSLRSM